MHIFNSISKKIEDFKPLEEKRVVIYVCGITPYDSAHIGHARTYVAFDMIKRYLIRKGFSVYHIQNITDVEDKIIKRCRETGADPKTLTEENHHEAVMLFNQLNILPADVYPKVTEHIPEIIALIQRLVATGHAYETGTGVYFDISSFATYGALSGQKLEEIKAGARVEIDETKHDPVDFALWKKTDGEIIEFGSPWGRGRPGWHIECSALSSKYAKRTLDIHGGGRDLIFPHHENEIAQSEAASGEKFCNYWMHPGFLTVHGEKMSKSLGNFITLKQAMSSFSPNAIRLFFLQVHYRSPLDYEEEKLEAMEETVERIFNSLGLIKEIEARGASHVDADFRKKSDELISLFYRHMDDDFNTPEAIAALFNLLRLANSHMNAEKTDHGQLKKIEHALEEMLWIIGLQEMRPALEAKKDALFSLVDEFGIKEQPDSAEAALNLLISLRDTVRKAKDYAKSDSIRAKLKEIGVTLEDKAGPGTPRWKID